MIAVEESDGKKRGRRTGGKRRIQACHRLRRGAAFGCGRKPRGRYMQMIPDGTRLAVLEEKGGWLRAEYRGHTGWISGAYCRKGKRRLKEEYQMEEKTMQVMKGVKPNAVNWIGALIGAALAWWTGLPPLAQALLIVQGATS